MKQSRYNVWLERNDFHFVFNGLSGALLRLDEAEFIGFQEYLNGDNEVHCSYETLEKLATARVFIPDDADELALLEKRYSLSRESMDHFALTIVTSLGCNFDCPYCFEDKHPSLLQPAVETRIIKMLADQLPRINEFDVTWFGGEPLVGKKPLLSLSDVFISLCDEQNVRYSASIVTNGYLLDKTTCIELKDRRVTFAQIGLDGPPSIHDKMRPLASGKGSFWRILENIHHAVEHMSVSVRVNIDNENASNVEELLQILEHEGLAGKMTVYPGQIHASGHGDPLFPRHKGTCFSKREFAQAEQVFSELAMSYGFHTPSLPQPSLAPCTAVRVNEMVVGSEGELYKCWNSVGDPKEAIGRIEDYENPNGRLQKWLKYDPFQNEECRECIALPGCMGGCASHAFTTGQYENRCGTFRHNYLDRVDNFVKGREGMGLEAIIPVSALVRRVEIR